MIKATLALTITPDVSYEYKKGSWILSNMAITTVLICCVGGKRLLIWVQYENFNGY